jgi:cardiolipin synthase
LSNAYFIPDPQLKRALVDAVSRGVDVKMVLPSATDSWLVFHAGRAHYDELLRGGVKLYERHDVLLHAKTAVIDGVWSTVGSTNLDSRSFLHNQEVNVLILGSEFGGRMRAAFERDLVVSGEITLHEWQRRGMVVRLKEVFGRVWEYWL